jgi:hypothetical protein
MFNRSKFACAVRIAGESMIGASETPTSPVRHTCHLAKPSCIEEGHTFVTGFQGAGRAGCGLFWRRIAGLGEDENAAS